MGTGQKHTGQIPQRHTKGSSTDMLDTALSSVRRWLANQGQRADSGKHSTTLREREGIPVDYELFCFTSELRNASHAPSSENVSSE